VKNSSFLEDLLKNGTVAKLSRLSSISGELNPWGLFTQVLAESLSDLQSGGGVFSSLKPVLQLTNKSPKFAGMDQPRLVRAATAPAGK
ncbi:hypothetical protein pipiens_006333, partial [Culex pipiens pipiens]